jgi:phosphoribosylformylglycinamidine cyclo-ligase
MKLELDQPVVELGMTLGDALLVPTRIYAKAVAELQRALGGDLHALCHVTGGGVPGNLPRVLPPGVVAHVGRDYPLPPIFDLIQRGGPVAEAEMQRTFNMGVGLVASVARDQADRAVTVLENAGERAWRWGELTPGVAQDPPRVEYR